MEDILHKIIPANVYEEMLTGAFKIAKDADMPVYGELAKSLKRHRRGDLT
jgi:hypothetical protein